MALSSKKFYFRKNNTTYSFPMFDHQIAPWCITVKAGNTVHYLPLKGSGVVSVTENGIEYYYNSSKPTIVTLKNGVTYYAFNDSKLGFSATNWAYAYSSSNVWQTTYSGKTIYRWEEHIYTISVKVTAPSTNVYDFVVVSNSGLWTGSLVTNPDISMNGSTTKTLSVQVKFRASSWNGDPSTHFVIGLRDRTNSVDTVVSQFTVNTYLSFGTTDSEE